MKTSGLTVRSADRGDVKDIADLYLEVAQEVVAREPSFRHVPGKDDVERRYHSRITDAERKVLVAVSGGAVTGFVDASLERHEDPGTYFRPGTFVVVEELIVTARERRRGVGTTLMRAIETWGRAADARMVWLETHIKNEAARQLYGGIGYREAALGLVKDL